MQFIVVQEAAGVGIDGTIRFIGNVNTHSMIERAKHRVNVISSGRPASVSVKVGKSNMVIAKVTVAIVVFSFVQHAGRHQSPSSRNHISRKTVDDALWSCMFGLVIGAVRKCGAWGKRK